MTSPAAPHSAYTNKYKLSTQWSIQILGKPLYKHLHPKFLSHLQKYWEDPVKMLATIQKKSSSTQTQ
jgi:hypothetical protein